MWKSCNVVMLPTNEKANIFIRDVANGRELFHNFPCLPQTGKSINSDVIAQHLYITSDEEIKEGEYGISKLMEIVLIGKLYDKSLYKKIIATTDTSLIGSTLFQVGVETHSITKSLPQPSQQFIQHYIEEYNKGNIIDKVEVEYGVTKNDNRNFVEFLWIAPENVINIKSIKDSWNREEINQEKEDFIHLFFSSNYDRLSNIGFTSQEIRKWIKENL